MVKTYISIIFSMLIVFTTGVSFGVGPEFTEVEPNNTPAQANAITLDQTVIGTFHYGDYDAGDYYSLTAPGKGRMTATIVLADPQCGIMLGAFGFHSDRRDIDWVPSSSSQPSSIWSKKGESPVSFSFPVQGGYKGFILVKGPKSDGGSFGASNWIGVACTKGGNYYVAPMANQQPRDLTATAHDGKRILPPLQYRLVVTFTGEGPGVDMGKPPIAVQPPQPPTITPPPPAADGLTQEITLAPGTVREVMLPATWTLDLLARIDYSNVAGANFGLDVSVNGHRLSSALLNKVPYFQYADGRTFSYYDDKAGAPGWLVFYSPNFTANNTQAGGGYQVMTNPGQAYRYQWDISSLSGGASTVRVSLRNNSRTANSPIVVRLPQSATILPPTTVQPGKGLRVVVQDEQGRPVTGTPVRVGGTPCAGEGTTDGSGVAVLRLPPGCP